MRGKGSNHELYGRLSGITPACAGKSLCRKALRDGRGDHPRLCGEKADSDTQTLRPWGSPPLVRGKAAVMQAAKRGMRITPACAGKSSPMLFLFASYKDHPRLCGEKRLLVLRRHRKLGSPPLVRGKDAPVANQSAQLGITPACAGKSKSLHLAERVDRDHPRLCGEKRIGSA